MDICAFTGGTFDNYAIVHGIGHIAPVDIYLPACKVNVDARGYGTVQPTAERRLRASQAPPGCSPYPLSELAGH